FHQELTVTWRVGLGHGRCLLVRTRERVDSESRHVETQPLLVGSGINRRDGAFLFFQVLGRKRAISEFDISESIRLVKILHTLPPWCFIFRRFIHPERRLPLCAFRSKCPF
ncbi:unnamed protein product, partial [Scytosiphon promiscuus]